MPYDGFTAKAVTDELKLALKGKRIQKIYQPSGNEINLHFSDREKSVLLMSAEPSFPRVYLTGQRLDNPPNAPPFCMLLRKYILNGEVTDVFQHEFDRIINIKIESLDEAANLVKLSLICEIMGRHSNIILVNDESGKIIDAVKHVTSRQSSVREVLPSARYVLPPNDKLNPFDFDFASGADRLSFYSEKNITNALTSTFMGLSSQLASSVAKDFGLDAGAPLFSLKMPYESCARAVKSFFDKHAIAPCVYFNASGKPVDFSAARYSSIEADIVKNADSVSVVADIFYSEKSKSQNILQRYDYTIKKVAKLLSREQNKFNLRREELREAQNYERYNMLGNLLLANLNKVRKGDTQIEVDNYYSENLDEKITIKLKSSLSASQNAQRYFKLYNKYKNAVEKLAELIAETENEIYFLSSQLYYLKNASDALEADEVIAELVKRGIMKAGKKKAPKANIDQGPIKYTSSDGYEILVGRNDRQNDRLSMRTASNEDIWLHAKDIAGSHVILRTHNGDYSETALTEAAGIAAFHSNGRDGENVPVDYTYVKNLKKLPGAPLGKVIFSTNKTVYVTPKREMGF